MGENIIVNEQREKENNTNVIRLLMKQALHIFITKRAMALSVIRSQLPASANNARDRELPCAASLPARVNLGLVLGEGEEGHANQVATPASASDGSASLGEPEEDGNHSHHSHSPASSQCSATYSNLGKNDTCRMICYLNLCIIKLKACT